MSISVKSYFHFANNEPEIRRFSIDADASTSYDYLIEKIRNVYPSLKRQVVQLSWKDEDEEMITFSSDDELIEALTHVRGEFFRVYVKVKNPKATSNGDGEEQVHPHVTCDGCQGRVIGSRFKCTVCPDYDLCTSCESKGLHAQHNLIRIRSPGAAPSFPWFMNMPWMHGRPNFARGCGPRRGGPWPGRGGPFPGFRRGRGGCFGFQDPRNGPASSSGNSASQPPAGEPRGDPRGDPQGDPRGDPCQSGQNTTGDEQAAFFHQFGDVLHTFLGPFGVDVHTFVDNNQGEAGMCGQHGNGYSCPTSSNPAGDDSETAEKTEKDSSNEELMDEASSPSTGDHTYVVVGDSEDGGGKKTDGDSALTDALAKMKAMGFTDDGGWLSQLLKSKNYDINKVLDAIQHPQKKQ